MTTLLAIVLTLGAAICLNYAMYLTKKAVDLLPAVKFEVSFHVFKAFVTNRPWVTATALSVVGGGVYAVAIAMAPVSIVQPILASGVVLLAYLAIKNLGERPRTSDYYAIGMTVLGVALIGVSLAEGIPETVKHDPVELWVFAAIVTVIAVIMPLVMRHERQAAGLGISVGLFFGLAAIFGRLLLVDWTGQWGAKGIAVTISSVFVIPWALTFIAGFIMMQAALQRGMAVVVVPLLSGLSQVVPILGGMIALNEPFPNSVMLSALRVIGFCLILVGTVVLSRRAEEVSPATEPGELGAIN
ncbi:MAG: hypothetical protein V1748_10570 [Actinomycetota bacterium]